MRRMMAVACASVMLAGAASGCFVSRKETVREQPRTSTYERHSTVETVPGDTEIRTKTTIDHD